MHLSGPIFRVHTGHQMMQKPCLDSLHKHELSTTDPYLRNHCLYPEFTQEVVIQVRQRENFTLYNILCPDFTTTP